MNSLMMRHFDNKTTQMIRRQFHMYLFKQAYQQQSMVRHPNYSKFSAAKSTTAASKPTKVNTSAMNILFYGYDIEKIVSENSNSKLVFQEYNLKEEISSVWVD